jgi:hypothetical protein
MNANKEKIVINHFKLTSRSKKREEIHRQEPTTEVISFGSTLASMGEPFPFHLSLKIGVQLSSYTHPIPTGFLEKTLPIKCDRYRLD